MKNALILYKKKILNTMKISINLNFFFNIPLEFFFFFRINAQDIARFTAAIKSHNQKPFYVIY